MSAWQENLRRTGPQCILAILDRYTIWRSSHIFVESPVTLWGTMAHPPGAALHQCATASKKEPDAMHLNRLAWVLLEGIANISWRNLETIGPAEKKT